MTDDFDFDKALKALQSGKAITGKDGVLTPLIKKLTEAALEAELDSHLAQDVVPNRKNGKTRKTVKSTAGPFELETPRDRAGNFQPQLIKKHQTSVNDEIEAKILSMYGLGMSYRDIATQVEDLYGITVSTATLSAITDTIIAEVREWQQRPLESLYPFVWLDAIHYKVKDNGRYQSKAVYTVLAVNLEGRKEILGLYLSESEGVKFWLSADRPSQSGRTGYSDCQRGWSDRLPRRYRGHLPQHRIAALHCPPGSQLPEYHFFCRRS